MNKIIALAAFWALTVAPAALAQYEARDGLSGLNVDKSSRFNAPIGHRQPRPSDLPPDSASTDNPTPIDPADAALKRKIKSICRGC
ncbi:hypothetical protein NB311A_18898 [Nitrobacter sp. Nb-311A]|uniref:hypothetical protein n=1 Tax=unclassified Nitrobacter TaxID=2620411 RepID=UPI000068663B|nr:MULTISPECIES: hypothetical protein [unclassified Nitrobacter]EAQ33741.1 hypothetical protein NB311A_18898 [Nitrobacter sp. Nb-311A]MCB1392446.1 hypothetical protein [Nitrobacter sp.]MCV0385395.1 hypothetical protein [Nitrobacter sp.]